LTYSLSDLAGAALVGAVVAVWATVAGESFSVRALVACEAAFLAFYLVGSLFAAWAPLAVGALFDLPLRLLMGYAAVNTALLGLAWLSPLGIVANFGVVLLVAAALFAAGRSACSPSACRWRRPPSGARTRSTQRPSKGTSSPSSRGSTAFTTRSTCESSALREGRRPSRTSGWPAYRLASITMGLT
jgi:hypothetical protein